MGIGHEYVRHGCARMRPSRRQPWPLTKPDGCSELRAARHPGQARRGHRRAPPRTGPGDVRVRAVAALTEILRPVVGAPAEEHARMMFGAMKAILQLRIERDLPLASAAPLLVDTFLHGMGAR
jgi:hypothetical protein